MMDDSQLDIEFTPYSEAAGRDFIKSVAWLKNNKQLRG